MGQWDRAADDYSRTIQYVKQLSYWRGMTQAGGLLAKAYVAVEQFSRATVHRRYLALLGLHRQDERFAAEWNRNLGLQGFADAFTDAAVRG